MEDFANHSEQEEVIEPVAEQETAAEEVSEQTEGQESPPQEEPKGIKVKYNKEERFVSEDELPTYVQKGLNYDKVAEKAKEADRYQQMLDRTAKFYGFNNHEEYMTALEQAEQDRRIQEEAEKLGVDEEVIRNHLQPLNQKLSQYEQELNTIREQENIRMVDAELASLNQKYADFGKYQEQVLQMSIDKGYGLEDSYRILTWEDRMNTAKQEAQRETLKSIQQNAASATGYLGADAPEQASGYAGMSPAEKAAFRAAVKAGRQP